MHPTDLTRAIDLFRAEVALRPDGRAALQTKLRRIMVACDMAGRPRPRDLCAVERRWIDEAVEDMFDNLPV